MKNLTKYHRGDTVSVVLSTSGDDISLADYDIDILVYTTPNGYKPRASSTLCGDCLPVTVTDDNRAYFTLDTASTAKMDPGICILETRYKHRITGASRILTNEIFILEDSIINISQCVTVG